MYEVKHNCAINLQSLKFLINKIDAHHQAGAWEYELIQVLSFKVISIVYHMIYVLA